MAAPALGVVKMAIGADVGGALGSLSSLGGALAKTSAAAMGLVGILGGLAVKGASDFESVLTSAASKTGDFTNAMAQFEEAAVSAGAKSAFSSQEAATALEELAMSGYSVQESTAALEGVLNGAAASGLELARTTEILTGITQGFGLEASEMVSVTDMMVKTANSSSQTMEQLGQSMSYAAPVANGLGISLSETSAVMGILADANIKGSRAGTGFNNVLSRMVEASDKLGGTLTEADVESMGFADSLAYLESIGLDSRNAMELFGREAGPSLQALLGRGVGAIKELDQELQNASGTAQEMADRQLDTLSGRTQILRGTIETLGIAVGKTLMPPLKALVEGIQDILGPMVATGNETSRFQSLLDRVSGAMQVLAGYVNPTISIIMTLGRTFGRIAVGLVRNSVDMTGSFQTFAKNGILLVNRTMINLLSRIAEFGSSTKALVPVINIVTRRVLTVGRAFMVWQGFLDTIRSVVIGLVQKVLSGLVKALGSLVGSSARVAAALGMDGLAGSLSEAEGAMEGLDGYLADAADGSFDDARTKAAELEGKIGDLQDAMKADFTEQLNAGLDLMRTNAEEGIAALESLQSQIENGEYDVDTSIEDDTSEGGDNNDPPTPPGDDPPTSSSGSSGVEGENLEILQARLDLINAISDVERARAQLRLDTLKADEEGLTGIERELALRRSELALEHELREARDRSKQRAAEIAHAEQMRTFLQEEKTDRAEEMAHQLATNEMEAERRRMQEEGLSDQEISLAMLQMETGLQERVNALLSQRSKIQKDNAEQNRNEFNALLSSMGSMGSALSDMEGEGHKVVKALTGMIPILQAALALKQQIALASLGPLGIAAGILGIGASAVGLGMALSDEPDDTDDKKEEEARDERLARKIGIAVADEQERRFGPSVQINVDAAGALLGDEIEVGRKLTDMVQSEFNNRTGGSL